MIAPVESSLRRSCHILKSLALIICLGGSICSADDPYSAVVTAQPGRIMDGKEVMSEVAEGACVCVFKTRSGGWALVKDPESNRQGWIRQSELKRLSMSSNVPEHVELVRLLDAGLAAHNRKDHSRTISNYEQALALAGKVLHADDLRCFLARRRLLLAYAARGRAVDRRKAERGYPPLLSDLKRVLGAYHYYSAITRMDYGLMLKRNGDYLGAIKHYKGASAIYQGLADTPAYDRAAALFNLAQADDLEVMRLQKDLAATHSSTTLYEEYYWLERLATDSNDWQALATDLTFRRANQ